MSTRVLTSAYQRMWDRSGTLYPGMKGEKSSLSHQLWTRKILTTRVLRKRSSREFTVTLGGDIRIREGLIGSRMDH